MNILLITAFFYPQNVIAVSRVGQWAKYWSMAGHKVTVLTTKKYPFWPLNYKGDLPENVTIIEVDFIKPWMQKVLFGSASQSTKIDSNVLVRQGMKTKLWVSLSAIKNLIANYFDPHDFWVKPAINSGRLIMRREKVDLIVSSFSPGASHKIAATLKKENPTSFWIADFRDLWSRNHMVDHGMLASWLTRTAERKAMRLADAITTVSDPLKEIIANDYSKKMVRTIENGFDSDEHPEWMTLVNKTHSYNQKLVIRYTGLIYPGRRDPTPIFTAINNLLDAGKIDKKAVQLEFYGNNCDVIRKIIAEGNFDRHGVIKVLDSVSRDRSLELQRSSDLLLFLEWNDPSAKGVLTGKLFEYMVSGRPILAVGIGETGAAANLITRAGVGVVARDVEHLQGILLNYVNTGTIENYNPNIELIDYYSRDKQAVRLLQIASEYK